MTIYSEFNYRTKKAMKDAVESGTKVTLWSPGPCHDDIPSDGTCAVCGPHYPEAHKWYARVKTENRVVVKVY